VRTVPHDVTSTADAAVKHHLRPLAGMHSDNADELF